MSHVSKVVSLAAALLLFAGGVSLAGPPDPTKPPTMQQPTPIKPQGAAPFWITQPTENEQIPAKTAFNVMLGATYPPLAISLKWEQKVNTSWQLYYGSPGVPWETPSELVIPVAEDFFPQPGNYRVRASTFFKHSPWRHFQIIPKARITPVPLPKLYPKPKIGPPPVEQPYLPPAKSK